MAQLTPTFELTYQGSGTLNSETWVDLSGIIPAGKQIWVGYATFIANDKPLTFEIRPNAPTKNASTIADTNLRGFATVATGESKDCDLYYYGNITTLAPASAASTGVEKLWLRIRSGSNSAGTFDYIIFYTIY